MTERWRCFVAVPLAASARDAIERFREPWMGRRDLGGLRWVDPSAWHLTLAFLGDVDTASVRDVIATVRRVAERHAPMRLPAGGLGAFPMPARARVAWCGIGDPGSHLAGLARDLGSELGVEVGDPFRPHVTIARARREPVDLRGWLADAADVAPSTTVAAGAIELMRSHRGKNPAAYETLASIPLAGARA